MAEYKIDEVKPASHNAWFTPAESNAYYKTPYSREGITVHWWGGGQQEDQHDGIVNYFLAQAEARVKSVNFVCSDKKITQMVDPDNVAWCSNNGNPTTISIEFEPGLSDEGYKRGGWLIATLEKKYGHKMNLYPHSKWYATACPGNIDINRLRSEADKASGGTVPATPAPAPAPAPKPSAGAQTVFLPSTAGPWRLYNVDSGYRPNTSDQKAVLRPDAFPPGLTYKIVENRGNVVVIDTQQFGRGAVWVAGTPAVISSGVVTTQPTPKSTGQTVTFPASVQSWAVYKVDSGYVKGSADQVGAILPAKFGGLTYPVVENRGNVVIIDTQAYGRVAAWVKDTDAVIR